MLYIEDINPADVRCPPEKRSVSFGSRECNGLQLTVRRDGSVHWYFRYTRPDGRRNTLTLGYSDATLEEVRTLRDEAAALLKRGIDPSQYKRKASRRAIEAQLAVGISVPTQYLALTIESPERCSL